jgi:hypothetical protein
MTFNDEHQIIGFMDGPSYTPFNLGLRHHAFGPYAPHLQAAKYTCKYKNIFLFPSSVLKS